MENYIVRIYRRDETNPDKMTGIFESVEDETQNTFTSLGSLIDLLTPKHRVCFSTGEADNKRVTQQLEPATLSD